MTGRIGRQRHGEGAMIPRLIDTLRAAPGAMVAPACVQRDRTAGHRVTRPARRVRAAPAPVPDRPGATRQNLAPDTVLFQRCCAGAFHSRRNHCALSCATGIEGSPAPVVHGPLRAIRMMKLAARLIGPPPAGFTCRGPAALTPGHAVAVTARKATGGINLRVRRGDGVVTMQACATFP